MISIIQRSNTDVSIVFKKVSAKIKKQIINAIIEAFPKNQNYFFELCGIDVDKFIEDAQSNNFLLIEDKRHKFVKNLPKLFLLSDLSQDVEVFSRYIGSFNEGYMYFYILKKANVELSDEQCLRDFININKLLTLEVDSDGDLLNVTCEDAQSQESLDRIIYNLSAKVPESNFRMIC